MAFVDGESSLLDDRGRAISTPNTPGEYEYTPEYEENDDPAQSVPAWIRLQFFLSRIWRLLAVIGSFGLLLGFAWWYGKPLGTLLGLSGTPAAIVGTGTILGGLLLFGVISLRWDNAGRSERTQRGQRTLEDLYLICEAIVVGKACPACGFSLREIEKQEDGCRVCPECGAAWRFDWWESFFVPEDRKAPIRMKKRHREAECQVDARGQVFAIASWIEPNERQALISRSKFAMGLYDALVMFLIFAIDGGVIGLLWIFSSSGISRALFVGFSSIVVLLILMVGLMAFRQTIRKRKGQRFVREQIGASMCPNCGEDLDETGHPIDGALVCSGCLHAWDPRTSRRKHHSRRSISDQKIKVEPVFEKPEEGLPDLDATGG